MHLVARHSLLAALTVLAVLCTANASVRATNGQPAELGSAGVSSSADLKELKEVDVVEKLGEQIPLDVSFTDEKGKRVRLADLVGPKPLLLTFNYSSCPLLCSVQLGGLVDTMRQMDYKLGVDFEVITIGLDPNESAEQSRETKAEYLRRLDMLPKAASGWHFLRGDKASIDRVAKAVGFGYHYYAPRKEYLHPAVNIVVSPSGSISGYQYGTFFDPAQTRDKLITAGYGEISETLARFIHACYYYEAPPKKTMLIKKIMGYGGAVFMFGFAIALVIMGRKGSQSRASAHHPGSP